ncbi:MAG: hypothetical protein ACRED7_09420 [Stellaceae bacterium]
MLKHSQANGMSSPRNLKRERRHWHDSRQHPSSLGCTICPQRTQCGTLHVGTPLYDCLNYCCRKPEKCDKVCPNNTSFPYRVREVHGFEFQSILRGVPLTLPILPKVSPVLFHGKSRERAFAPHAVVLSLYSIFNRRYGTPRFVTRAELCSEFKIGLRVPIILTGTDEDPPLERWWNLSESRRRMIIRNIRNLGVMLATTPNYSLFTDVPRWNDLHAMRRIQIIFEEFIDEGLPTALHVNGRTETDFRRWAEYIAGRPEITHLAYEFTTGTGWRGRREQHASWLLELSATVKRPLDLVIRGGVEVLPILRRGFPRVSILDTKAFMKTIHRQKAFITKAGRVTWRSNPTPLGAPLDALLEENFAVVESWLSGQLSSDLAA